MFTSLFDIHTVFTIHGSKFSVRHVSQKVPVQGEKGFREKPTHQGPSHKILSVHTNNRAHHGVENIHKYNVGLVLLNAYTRVPVWPSVETSCPPGATPLTLALPYEGAWHSCGAGSTQ